MKTLQPCLQICNSAQWTDENGTAVDFSLLTENPFVTNLEKANDNCVYLSNATFLSVNCNSAHHFVCQKQCRLKGNGLSHFLVFHRNDSKKKLFYNMARSFL